MTFTKTKYTEQYMQNWGFDDTFKVPTVEILGHEPVGDTLKRIKVSTDGTVAVSATIDTTGLATTATDTNTGTIAGDTTSIDSKTPALGQALAAASVPVVLPADQVSTLTPPAAITGFATSANQLPDGHNVTVDNASGASAVNIQDGGNTITVDGTVTANLGATDNAVLDGIAGFTLTGYDYIALTYVAAGNGAGEVETATFKTGGSGGSTIATLTLTYDASNRVATVTKT